MDRENTEIIQIFKKNNGYARTKEILGKGIHHRKIKAMVKSGKIIKVKRGLYKLPSVDIVSNQSFVDVSRAVPEGVICLLSALSFYELTTFIPQVVSMAIYRKAWRPQIDYPPVEFYYFSRKQFQSGIDQIKIKRQEVRIYCPEKTICDCFRYRNKLGMDIAREGLNEYLKREKRDLDKLLKFADICRVKPLLRTWLEAKI